MRIAFAKESEKVAMHFGHCEGFEVYDVDGKEVLKNEFIENPGHRPGFLPVFLAEKNVNVIIAGGMGKMAQDLFNENGINVIVGADGEIKNVLNEYLNNNLKSTDSVCEEHAHHGEGCNH